MRQPVTFELSTFDTGYSHLALAPELERYLVSVTYSDYKAPELPTYATLVFKGAEGILQRLVFTTELMKLSKAIQMTNQIVADLLDAFSLSKRVPISIRHIEVYADGGNFIRHYVTLPYYRRELTVADITETMNIPWRIRSSVRLFRAGLSSNKPPYRLLCLYRIREVIYKVQSENNREFLERDGHPDRPSRVLPDNELTRRYFPSFVGKKVGAFLDHVRDKYRLAVAHGNLNEYFGLVLDPANVHINQRLDSTNAVLAPVVAEMIQDEIDFMNRSGLLGSAPQSLDGATAKGALPIMGGYR